MLKPVNFSALHIPYTKQTKHSLHPVYSKHVEMMALGVITFLHYIAVHCSAWYCNALQYCTSNLHLNTWPRANVYAALNPIKQISLIPIAGGFPWLGEKRGPWRAGGQGTWLNQIHIDVSLNVKEDHLADIFYDCS